ncbi:hypothetical protein C0995_007425 [Termitomyces sp. Mi166|nr:hypothetical protein C0995_007425 [Termitomyces sp. Mi166\
MAPGLFVQPGNPSLAFFGTAVKSLTVTPWRCDHTLPVYVSIASAAILFIHVLISSKLTRPVFVRLGFTGKSEDAVQENTEDSHIQRHGGHIIFAAEVLTLIGSLELLRVALLRIFAIEGPQRIELIVASIPFAYASLLALFAVAYSRSTVASSHVPLVLGTSWIVYFIRDVVPLMTYTESPLDPLYMLWELIGVLSFTGVLLPLITPRPYVPFDPTDPMPPNPSQTASWLSLTLFGYLDPAVWLAYKVPHLPLTDLPPLADSDHAKNLVRAAFPHLDPFSEVNIGGGTGTTPRQEKKARPIFRAILTVFRKDVISVTLLLLAYNAASLLSPYGLKKLLEYLESREEATVRPWVWIASLFVAPFAGTLVMQQYQMVLARATVHLEAILTQLILQHALRIRVVAEGKSEPVANTGTHTPVPSISGSSSSSGASSSQPETETESTAVASEADTKATPAAASTDAQKSLVGRMNNLITSDLQTITKASEFMQVFVAGPVMVILCIAFLYTILGWSAFVGFGVMLVLMPMPVAFSKLLQGAAKEVSKKGDDRVETVTETMSVIRMIKMFGWEKKMAERIDEKREAELTWVWWNKIYSLLTMNFQFSGYILTCSDHEEDSGWTYMLFMWVPMVVKGNVSLQRISDFLQNTELLDEFTEDAQEHLFNLDYNGEEIGFCDATFSWSNDDGLSTGSLTPSKRRFRLHIKDELLFKRGAFNLIIGPTGEMHFMPSGPGAWYNLPRSGGVAYAAQESWVLNATIKDNILFGAPLDEERYKKVIHQCSLTRDLELFKAGDLTEVGEKGLTLSGGQKARITLARAIYSSAEILLLDDVLAALDVHTAKWIVEKCFVGDLVQGRTVLLVTHNVNMAAPISEFVVSLGSDGQILSQGSISDALAKNSELKAEVAEEKQREEKAEQEIDDDQEAETRKEEGKLIVEEESGEGHISWASVKMYLVALGGKYWMVFWPMFTAATVFECTIEILQPWLLGAWATEYSIHPPEEVNVTFYLVGYVLLVCLMLAVFFVAQTTLTLGALRASASLHKRLIETILGTTLRWLDKTPTSRVITRVTQDVAAVDTTIPDLFSHMFEIGVIIVVRFFAILIYTPTIGLFAIIIFVVGGVVGNIYMKAQLAVKREMSKAKAPVMAHFGASIEGITSIRAYGAQNSILLKSLAKVDNYSRASRVFNDFARWIAVRVDALGGCFAALLGIWFVYNPNTGVSTSNSAFTLNSKHVRSEWCVLLLPLWPSLVSPPPPPPTTPGNSLERLQEYMTIEQEPKSTDAGEPPASWPASGALRVRNLTARYVRGGPAVLRGVSFDVRAGERVGVVGRTGSGKSSLMLALLRCVDVDVDGDGDGGERGVWFDGLRTQDVNLERVRGGVTVIPQVPELLSGTLRRNLDPFDQFDDATLNASLRDAGLYALQSADDESRLTLESAIARGGSNLSVGQRQIVALARAMVRESKLLILDEDYKTDAIIQTSLRTKLSKDVTVLTVAHRLQTIMDADRIMVLDAGQIVEFDKPWRLLEREDGYLRRLVDESGDREALWESAERGREGEAG